MARVGNLSETCADWTMKFLDKQGIEFIFGHPGGPVLPFYEALRKSSKPRHVLVRHEGAGSFMADAYSKVTGKVGVCMSTMGPGAANMTIGVGTAMSDSTPLIAITGQLSLKVFGKGYQQETNHTALFSGITKASLQVKRADTFAEVFERAYRIAVSGRPGPVHIDVPVDLSGAEMSSPPEARMIPLTKFGSAEPGEIRRAAEMISKASNPVILAGGGVVFGDASRELVDFAETLQLPVATSFNGRGSIPENHPLSLGRVGEYTPSYARKLAEQADLLIALGYRFTDVSLDNWKIPAQCNIIQIDIDPTEFGKNITPSLSILGNIRDVLPQILSELKSSTRSNPDRSTWIRQVKDSREAWSTAYSKIQSSDEIPIKPQRVMKELAKFTGGDVIVAAGAGRAKMWAASVLPILNPRTWIHSGGYAVMGYELCGALAAKLARPESRVIAISGDGSFQMHAQELATAVEQRASFLAVVLNDKSLASIRNAQLKRYGKPFGTDFELDVNLADVAKAFGADGRRITKPSELYDGIKEGLNSTRPYVLDVVVDGREIPTFELP